MRYNEVLKEANYRNRFDSTVKYNTDAEFRKAVGDKFDALKGAIKVSKPQAGGAVYIMDALKGIVGYKFPNAESPSGFSWYAAKEPFMPVSKGTKSEPQEPTQAVPLKNKSAIVGKVKFHYDKLGGKPTLDSIMAFIKSIPELSKNVGFRSDDGYQTTSIYSQTLSKDEIIALVASGKAAAVKSATPAAKPTVKPASSPAVKTGPVTDDDLEDALYSFLSAVKSSANAGYGYRTDSVEKQGNSFSCGIRDWGVWVMPDDEDDDGDYDWQVLSDKSKAAMKQIVDAMSARYPKIKFTWQTEEKNWIMMFTRAK